MAADDLLRCVFVANRPKTRTEQILFFNRNVEKPVEKPVAGVDKSLSLDVLQRIAQADVKKN